MSEKEQLKNKTRKGIFWSAVEKISTQGMQFLFSIILARLLTPEDYGIIAMPMVFLVLAQVFIDSGFSNALIRKPDLTEKDLSTAFYFNVIVGVFCYAVLFISSPYIASFYDTAILEDILKVTALTTLFTPLCAVQQALLTIKIDFKTQAKISLSSQLCTGIVGVAMAYHGFGVWALAISQAAASFLRTILLWYFSHWRPKEKWSRDSFRYLWGFGSKLLGAGILDCLYQNMYTLIIGKVYPKASLGFYTRAQNFAHLPTSSLYSIIKRVSFPVLSSLQNDDEQLMLAFKKIYRQTVFVIFPILMGIAGSASPLFSFLLTDKWLPAVPYFQILCFAMMWLPVDALNLNLLTIHGRSDLFLKLEIIKKIIGVIILLLTVKLGVLVLCIGYCLYCLIEIFTDTYYTGRLFMYGLIKQIKDIAPVLVLSFVIFMIGFINSYIGILSPILQLSLNAICIIAFFWWFSKLFVPGLLKDTICFIRKK